MTGELLVEMQDIEKSFSGVKVLRNGVLHVRAGEIHALMGANGAGKSTLMKILVGVYTKDGGSIRLANGAGVLESVETLDPRSANRRGIAIVHQELILLDDMTVSANINLGSEPMRRWGVIDDRAAQRLTREAMAKVGLSEVNPGTLVGQLPTAKKQLVEIARALSCGAQVIVLDEPTTALSTAEASNLMEILRSLRDDGVAIVYISHRMDEIFALTDRITVMRDGEFVDTVATDAVDRDRLVRLMIGRELQQYSTRLVEEEATGVTDRPVTLKVENLSTSLLKTVSLEAREGEIVGLFGLVGAGRTELARAIFGIDHYDSGSVVVKDRPLGPGSPAKAAAAGLGFVPEERKQGGLVLGLSNIRNLELAGLRRWPVFTRSSRQDDELWNRYARSLGIVARGPHQETGRLSGGNQQKIVLGKWLALDPSILILDEPTKGIDVAAKQDIYEQIRQLADRGVSIVVISSESEEIRMLSDRVVVMREGAITYQGINRDLDDETLLRYAMGEAA
ncbi:MAG: sugar ABC transporter ATP-binding protein [Propionibacteriaceae bacterium]|nr:sugar ABC transporter ATP-binding protein [Propionibacteriaceae bacterium]